MIVCFTLLTLLALNSCGAAILNPNPVNGSVISKCTGSDVILPWTYSLSPGDDVQKIAWFFNHKLASKYIFNLYFVTPSHFHGHVERIVEGNVSQLMIKNVSNNDSGNYSIRIQGNRDNGSSFILARTLTLEVKDDLETSDHKIHVSQNSSPVWDPAKSRWSVQLACGNFLHKQTPPFDVQWLNPSGNTMGSTGYQNGTFYLLLPSSLEGGNYTCRLSKQTPNACLSEDLEATLTVDSQNATLATNESDLTSDQQQEQVDYETLIQELQDQKIQNQKLQDLMNIMNQELQDQREATIQTLVDQKKRDDQQQEHMKTMNQQLQDQIKTINKTQSIQNRKQQDEMNMMNQELQDQREATIQSLVDQKKRDDQQQDQMKTLNQTLKDQMKTLNQTLLNQQTQNQRLQDQIKTINKTQNIQNQKQQDQMNTINKALLDQKNKVEERKVSFHARGSHGITIKSTHSTMVMKTVLLNQGSGYDPRTGQFTAPYPGTYFFSASSGTCGHKRQKIFVTMYKNGNILVNGASGYTTSRDMFTLNAVTRLVKGGIISVKAKETGCYESRFNSFSGFLIHQ